jgi:predicted PurR-regulated permease PerM
MPVALVTLISVIKSPMTSIPVNSKPLSRSAGVTSLFAAAAAVVVALGLAIVPVAVSQAGRLLSKLPHDVDTLARRLGISNEALLEELREKVAGLMQDPISNLSFLWDG